VIDIVVLSIVTGYLLGVFGPGYLLLKTIAAGGDTASHFYTAKYLQEVLLPHGRISGWTQGNLAGFPILQFYFPLPFLIISILGCALPLQIAFKLVTVLGTFLMPICAYTMFRLMRCESPVPALGAVATLPFLCNEGNSMWGGNIPSSLAGEFSYSLAMGFAFLFLGSLYRDITFGDGRRWIVNALLVFLIGFTHAYPLLFVGVASLYFLVTGRDFLFRLFYLSRIYLLAFLLLGFWIVPLLAFSSYTIPFNIVWAIPSFYELLPKVLLPGIIISAGGTVFLAVKQLRARGTAADALGASIGFLWFCVLASIPLYLVAQTLGVVDIRFVPFAQLSLSLLAAPAIGLLARRLRGADALALAIGIATVVWVDIHQKSVPDWVKWNYEGFERKPAWKEFNSITEYLRGTMNDPRVVYEHSPDNDRFGSVRAFESLPLFSNRATLEGLYLQASLSSPFVFFIQSEVSKVPSCPFPQYSYTHLDLKHALDDLELFNVGDFIVKSKEAKEAVKTTEGYRFKKAFGDYEIYTIEAHPNRYVVPLRFKPVLADAGDYKELSYRWFLDRQVRDIPIVFAPPQEFRPDRFAGTFSDFRNMPREKTEGNDCIVNQYIDDDEIRIFTDCIGKPLLVKFSYHPNWKVQGADRIYLVSPSFMLIYPDKSEVRLHYGRSLPDYAGLVLTLFGVACVLGHKLIPYSGGKTFLEPSGTNMRSRSRTVLVPLAWVIAIAVCLLLFFSKQQSPMRLLNRAVHLRDAAKYEQARRLFMELHDRNPSSSLAIDSLYHIAITYFREKQYAKALETFKELVDRYPSSNWVPEAQYHVGLCLQYQGKTPEAKATFEGVVGNFVGTPWQEYAKEQLRQLQTPAAADSDTIPEKFNRAINLFNAERCEDAKPLLREVFEKYQDYEGSPQALACYALCFYKEGKCQETIAYYTMLLDRYPKHWLTEEARIHIERCEGKRAK
jgi:TolA-binding protein